MELIPSLLAVRAYIQYLQYNQPFPDFVETHKSVVANPYPQKGVYEWQLEILAKELVLNAPVKATENLCRWSNFANAINLLKRLEEDISTHYEKLIRERIWWQLFRTSHRQFPWQQHPNGSVLTRYYKIFSHPELDRILAVKTGLTAKVLYSLGLSFCGEFNNRPFAPWPQRSEIPWVSQENLATFVSRFSIDLSALRQKLREAQSYDENYAHTLNPMRLYPMVKIKNFANEQLFSPIPTYLFQRFTDGVYYEIYDVPGFDNAFGAAFQRYVGEVLSAANPRNVMTVHDERPYKVRKDKKHSIDWIVSDATGDLFIECKTKRLRLQAKISLEESPILDEDLGKLASFIAQTYKTLAHAKAGLYEHWKPREPPCFSIVLTLEDWFTLGPIVNREIEARLQPVLEKNSIGAEFVAQHPYTVCSIGEFERVIRVMEEVGIAQVMAAKTTGEFRDWTLKDFVRHRFPNEFKKTAGTLFTKELSELGEA